MEESAKLKENYHEELELALKAREQFLKEQPHLQAFQDEIDRILEKTVGFENRMAVLAFMMEVKLSELKAVIADLQSSFKVQPNKTKVKGPVILDYSQDSTGYLN